MTDPVDLETTDGTVVYVTRHELADRGFVRTEDLMSGTDLAELFDVGRSTIGGWVARRESNKMPGPVATLATGPVYDGYLIIQWWKRWRPRKGRKAGSLPEGV
jgi:hypothetical protein